MTDPDGPHVAAGLICERILQEADGVISAIRMIDRVYFAADPEGNLINPAYPITILIALKSGAARGNFSFAVEMEKPSGERIPILKAPVLLEGEDRGANLILNHGFVPDQQGLYWFDVFFEENRITRIPLRAVFQPQPTTGHGG